MKKKLALIIAMMTVLIGFPALSQAGESSFFHAGEGWLLRAYTEGVSSPYTVKLEVVSTGNVLIAPATIVGLATLGNPVIISALATSPDVSLSFDTSTSTAYVFYTVAGGLQLQAVPNLVAAGPSISVTPTPLAFGSVNVGNTLDRTVTVSNAGNANLTLGTIAVTGTGFSRNAGNCVNGQTLTSRETCTIIVRCAPNAAGAYSGALSIPSNDQDINVPLSGTGVAAGSNIDLAITNISTAARGVDNGYPFTVSVTVANQGSSPSAAFTVKGYFSADLIPGNTSALPDGKVVADRLLFTWNVTGLAAGASQSNSFTVSFNSFPIHQVYYVVAKADADNVVSESNESNNVRSTGFISVSR